MWILFRLAVALIAFVARWFWKVGAPKTEERNGLAYAEVIERNRGKIASVHLAVDLKTSGVFSFHEEGWADRLFKAMGAAQEFQSGDAHFDRVVYIACDRPLLAASMVDSPELREAILGALRDFTQIRGDGQFLWLKKKESVEATDQERETLFSLRALLVKNIPDLEAVPSLEPYFWRIVLVEALVWSIFAYAISAFFELPIGSSNTRELNLSGLFKWGGAMALILFVVLFGLVRWVLQGSSRAHRVLVESAVVLTLTLPIAGLQLAADLNTGLDRTEPTVYSHLIQNKEVREHRRSRGRTSYSYYLQLGDLGASPVPEWLQVDREVYDRMGVGRRLDVSVKPGWLGQPWIGDLGVR